MDIRTMLNLCWTVWFRILNSPRFQRLLAKFCKSILEELLIVWPDFRQFFYSQEFQSFLVSPFFEGFVNYHALKIRHFFSNFFDLLISRFNSSTDNDLEQGNDDDDLD
ncbi:hypothetical protein CDAR_523281 [Caerostris darwini]|uniref:Uncharacterized protein n=1 Tax=Caerostris darwini TaxID=1538125 RepID=A0AAV4V399_9ARAC|nr:hypothetical protein CDAR_523281 [Caerostris darwini]